MLPPVPPPEVALLQAVFSAYLDDRDAVGQAYARPYADRTTPLFSPGWLLAAMGEEAAARGLAVAPVLLERSTHSFETPPSDSPDPPEVEITPALSVGPGVLAIFWAPLRPVLGWWHRTDAFFRSGTVKGYVPPGRWPHTRVRPLARPAGDCQPLSLPVSGMAAERQALVGHFDRVWPAYLQARLERTLPVPTEARSPSRL